MEVRGNLLGRVDIFDFYASFKSMQRDWGDSTLTGYKNYPQGRGRWRRKTGETGHRAGERGKSVRKNNRAREDNKSTDSGLTSWAASEDQLTDFIIDKDEQGVWEGAEPPVGPGNHTITKKG